MTAPINDIETLKKELDKKYLHSTDSINYGQILSGVASRIKVHDIIKDIVTITSGTSKAPYFMSEYKQFLYGYMNECIADLYEKSGETSMDSFCEAWINIRAHENKKSTRERIEQIAKSRGLEVDKTIKDIHKTFHEFEHNYKTLKQFSYGTNGYNQYLPLSKNGAATLLKYKFDPYGLPYGLGWGSNIFTEVEKEQKTNKRTQDSHLSNWRQIKKGESVQNIGKKKEKDPNSLTTGQIIALVIGGLLIGAIAASPLGPWVMVFVLMYCLLVWGLK